MRLHDLVIALLQHHSRALNLILLFYHIDEVRWHAPIRQIFDLDAKIEAALWVVLELEFEVALFCNRLSACLAEKLGT